MSLKETSEKQTKTMSQIGSLRELYHKMTVRDGCPNYILHQNYKMKKLDHHVMNLAMVTAIQDSKKGGPPIGQQGVLSFIIVPKYFGTGARHNVDKRIKAMVRLQYSRVLRNVCFVHLSTIATRAELARVIVQQVENNERQQNKTTSVVIYGCDMLIRKEKGLKMKDDIVHNDYFELLFELKQLKGEGFGCSFEEYFKRMNDDNNNNSMGKGKTTAAQDDATKQAAKWKFVESKKLFFSVHFVPVKPPKSETGVPIGFDYIIDYFPAKTGIVKDTQQRHVYEQIKKFKHAWNPQAEALVEIVYNASTKEYQLLK